MKLCPPLWTKLSLLAVVAVGAAPASCSDNVVGIASTEDGLSEDEPADRASGADASLAGLGIESISLTLTGRPTSEGPAPKPFRFDALAAGPEDGELVLLLHGFPLTSYEWRAQLVALGAAGYRAVAPDQRGYSPGARPAEPSAYQFMSTIMDAFAMIEALGYPRYHVVGFDVGATIAWWMASLDPRVISVTSLSMPHSDAFLEDLLDPSACQHETGAYLKQLSSPDSPLDEVRSWLVGELEKQLPKDTYAYYFEHVLSDDVVFEAALNWLRVNPADPDNPPQKLGMIHVPTQYLWGTQDPYRCRDTAERTADFVDADYRFVPVEGGGHWLSETHPDEVTEALLSWLQR